MASRFSLPSLRRRPRRMLRGGVLLLWILAATGCGPERDSARSGPREETGGPQPGGTAVIALAADPDVLNSLIRSSSYAGMVLAELQDGLAELDEQMEWAPRIASGWEIAPDLRSITYHLKPWVWSDGQPLTSRDVISTWELIADERVASNLRGFYGAIEAVEAPDARTVRYTFQRPVPDPLRESVHPLLPDHLTRNLDPAAIRTWAYNRDPVTNGYFKLERWEHNRDLSIVRNGLYPGPAPYLDRVVFRVIPEQSAQVLALEAGEVDMVDGLPPAVARRLADDERIRIVDISGRTFYYLLWNTGRPGLADAATRRALSLAIDRRRMIDTLMLGYAVPAASCFPPAVWNHDPGLAADPFDPVRAREMLAAAGWSDTDGDGIVERNGRPLRFTVITKQGDPVRENGLVLLGGFLRDVGAELVPLVLEHATGLERIRRGDFDAYLGRFNANLFGDPSLLVHSSELGRYNYGHYANAEVDSLLELALAEIDRDRARPLWHQLQRTLAEDPPAAYLFYPEMIVGVNRRLRDVRPHLMSPFNNLSEWWIAPQDRRYRSPETAR